MRKLILTAAISVLSTVFAFSQVDTSFWFAAPDISSAASQGDFPVFLRFITYSNPAVVTVSQPANGSFTPIVLSIPANSVDSINMTFYLASIENSTADVAANKGLKISSTQPIGAMYELRSTNNREYVSLKGSKALGTDFYTPFHEGVEHTLENADRAVGERALGTDEATGKPIIARMGRYGPMVQIGVAEGDEKPKFAKLKPSQSIETNTMEEAQELFKLPLSLGEHDNLEVSVNLGRFGPYVKWGEQFVSIPKGEDLWSVTLERAIEIINAKQKEDAPIGFYEEKPITKGKGRFGPLIKWNALFNNIQRT